MTPFTPFFWRILQLNSEKTQHRLCRHEPFYLSSCSDPFMLKRDHLQKCYQNTFLKDIRVSQEGFLFSVLAAFILPWWWCGFCPRVLSLLPHSSAPLCASIPWCRPDAGCIPSSECWALTSLCLAGKESRLENFPSVMANNLWPFSIRLLLVQVDM